MFANSMKCSWIQKNILGFRKWSKICKNVHGFKFVHEFKNIFMISKFVHDFTKLRVIVYLGDAAICGHHDHGRLLLISFKIFDVFEWFFLH